MRLAGLMSRCHTPDGALRQARRGTQHLCQVAPLHVLHGDEGGGVVLAVLVDGNDARMRQPPHRLGLVAKARRQVDAAVGLHQGLADGLDRHRPVDAGVVALVDHAHGALAQHLDDVVLAQALRVLHVFSSPDAARRT
ncbi:MAG: hypothetical protein DI563_14340 [Variovorax paradoxus]|uniref:Uncharacterized protein n=1 Tax=Variovorax paradoxus TaxID=34073 RepID=A0A2W5S1Q7_VARPD|nr:MAG: hypothetical protein DI563_14340 [Variovorax paradoxus]